MSRRTALKLPWLLAALPVAFTIAHLIVSGPTLLHSDGALKSVLVALALEQHRLVPHGWTFANGDLLLSSPYFLLLPIQWIGGLGVTTNILSTALCYLLMVVSVVWFCRQAEASDKVAAGATPLATAIVASSVGAGFLEFTVTQGAYSLLAAIALTLFGLALFREGRSVRVAIVVLAFTATVSNPLRGVVQIIAPLVIAMTLIAMVTSGTFRVIPGSWRNIVSICVGAALGWVVYTCVLMPGVSNFDAAARVQAPTFASALQASSMLLRDGFSFMSTGEWASLSPLGRLLQYVSWAVFALGLLAPAFALVRRSTPAPIRAMAWVAYGTLAAGVLPLVLTRGLYQGFMEWRYAFLGLVLGWIVLAFLVRQLMQTSLRQWMTASMFVGVACVAAQWPFVANPGNVDAQGVSNGARTTLVAELKRHGVGLVAGTYWNSHVLTVLSKGGVVGAPISYDQRIGPFPHHMPHKPEYGSFGRSSAIALTRAEWDMLGMEGVAWQFGQPADTFESGPFKVKVFDHELIEAALDSSLRFDEPEDFSRVKVDLSPREVHSCREDCIVSVRVRNSSDEALSGNGMKPFRIGLVGFDAVGKPVDFTGIRFEFHDALSKGETQVLRRRIDHRGTAASYRPCLLQENVAWLCGNTTYGESLSSDDARADTRIGADRLLVGLKVEGLDRCSSVTSMCKVRVDVSNRGDVSLSPSGHFPMRIGVQAVDDAGRLIANDVSRIDFTEPLLPGSQATLEAAVPSLAPGETYRFCLLQEGQQWHCDRTLQMAPSDDRRASAIPH